jgi:hypothetical protein
MDARISLSVIAGRPTGPGPESIRRSTADCGFRVRGLRGPQNDPQRQSV